MASFKALAMGCCLLAVASGCRFHRTTQGFVIQGRPWSLAFDRGCAMSEGCEIRCMEQADAKPELLPWRSRLKGYRLAARLGRHETTDSPESTIQLPPAPTSERPDLVLK